MPSVARSGCGSMGKRLSALESWMSSNSDCLLVLDYVSTTPFGIDARIEISHNVDSHALSFSPTGLMSNVQRHPPRIFSVNHVFLTSDKSDMT